MIWALRDVSFELQHGEILGVFGRNGAGKSTLLKILSRITKPSTGEVELNGSVRSLLEIGTGFHAELTGRENIYLNGAILGMRRREITERFHAIVEFSEVTEFLDTPVKRYSSGMYVKLAFAVAAHLDSDILLVDEVLAVGDLQFQRKCLGKLDAMAGAGRTVIFVSHQLQQLRRLCTRGLYMKDGRIAHLGGIDEAIDDYIADMPHTRLNAPFTSQMHMHYPPPLEVYRMEVRNRDGRAVDTLRVDEAFRVRLDCRFHTGGRRYRIGLAWRNSDGVMLASWVSTVESIGWMSGREGEERSLVIESRNVFLPGTYYVDVIVRDTDETIVDRIDGITINVEALSVEKRKSFTAGFVRLPAQWSVIEPD